MEVHRINGIKFNFDRLSDEELRGIQGHLLAEHRRVTDDIGLVEEALFARHNEQLPFQELGGTALYTEVSVEGI